MRHQTREDPRADRRPAGGKALTPTAQDLGWFDPFLMFTFQKIMKRLIKRYVLKAQVDRENDEVNEGKRLDPSALGRKPDVVSPG